jgi:hypothetical protein
MTTLSSSPSTTSSDRSFLPVLNQVKDKVYVKDEIFGWLPGAIIEIDNVFHRVLVCIHLPKDWDETTTSCAGRGSIAATNYEELNLQKRWVYLRDYYNRILPMQNVCNSRNTNTFISIGDLQHINEAEILYQIKSRYSYLCANNSKKETTFFTPVTDNILIAVVGRNIAVQSCSTDEVNTFSKQREYAKKIICSQSIDSCKRIAGSRYDQDCK